jgi:hypothetical protein
MRCPKKLYDALSVRRYSTTLSNNQINQVGYTGRNGPVPWDAPGVDLIYKGTPQKAASYTYQFQTFVDYSPGTNGLHIELAKATWTVQASVAYTGPLPPTGQDYFTPSNWTWYTNVVKGPTVTPGIFLPEWKYNVDDLNDQYSY